MARVAGRSNWVAWPVGVVCAAVLAVLVVLAAPLAPAAVLWVGDALRGPTSAPAADAESPQAPPPSDVELCRSLYTRALWSELTARVGGDPVQDGSPPIVSATSVVAALSPAVRATCTWTAATTGSIVTTLADVTGEAGPIAEAALTSQGYACRADGSALTCTRTDGDVTDEIVVRDGVWLSSRLTAWHPDLYTARIAGHLWEE